MKKYRQTLTLGKGVKTALITKKRTVKLRQYAKDFCNQVRSEFPQIPLASKNPIVECFSKPALGKNNVEIAGLFIPEKGKIEVYNILHEKFSDLKTTMRHECIHFLLYESGLQYEDTSETFLLMAAFYNARPYGILVNEDFQNKYGKVEELYEYMPALRQGIRRAARFIQERQQNGNLPRLRNP